MALYLAAYYLQLLKWPHIANQFHFTQVSDTRLTEYSPRGSCSRPTIN